MIRGEERPRSIGLNADKKVKESLQYAIYNVMRDLGAIGQTVFRKLLLGAIAGHLS